MLCKHLNTLLGLLLSIDGDTTLIHVTHRGLVTVLICFDAVCGRILVIMAIGLMFHLQ